MDVLNKKWTLYVTRQIPTPLPRPEDVPKVKRVSCEDHNQFCTLSLSGLDLEIPWPETSGQNEISDAD